MGSPQSKNEEVVIAQVGANDANATTTLEKKVELFSIFVVLVIVIVGLFVFYKGCRHCGLRAKSAIVNDMVSSLEKGAVAMVATARPTSEQVPTY